MCQVSPIIQQETKTRYNIKSSEKAKINFKTPYDN